MRMRSVRDASTQQITSDKWHAVASFLRDEGLYDGVLHASVPLLKAKAA